MPHIRSNISCMEGPQVLFVQGFGGPKEELFFKFVRGVGRKGLGNANEKCYITVTRFASRLRLTDMRWSLVTIGIARRLLCVLLCACVS